MKVVSKPQIAKVVCVERGVMSQHSLMVPLEILSNQLVLAQPAVVKGIKVWRSHARVAS